MTGGTRVSTGAVDPRASRRFHLTPSHVWCSFSDRRSVPFLSVDHYLSQLPAGLRSYPDAQAKGTVVLPWLQGTVGKALLESPDLPKPLRTLIEEPPTVGAWVSEVALAALILAAYDAHFARVGAGGADELQSFIHTTNRAAFKSPLYSILFAVVSPERLLAGAAQRWSAFHRGSKLEAVDRTEGHALLELSHRPDIFSDHSLHGHGTSFVLAAELAGAEEAQMTYTRIEPTLTRYTIAWR